MPPKFPQGSEPAHSPAIEKWPRKVPLIQITATFLILYGIALLALSGWYFLRPIQLGWNYVDYMGLIIFTPAIILTLIPAGALFLTRAGWILLEGKHEKSVRGGRTGTILILLPTLVVLYFETNSGYGYGLRSITARRYLLFLLLNILLLIYLVIFKEIMRRRKS